MANEGMLHVTMQPDPGLSLDEFNEWYNNEHGPTRMRLSQIFSDGVRWHATDGASPEFLATYDVLSMDRLETPEYTQLREKRSPRELSVITQVNVKRRFLDSCYSRQSPLMQPFAKLSDGASAGTVLISIEASLNNSYGAFKGTSEWYDEERLSKISEISGWRRTRLLRTSSQDPESDKPVLMALYEFTKDNGLRSSESDAARLIPWRDEVGSKYVATAQTRTFSLIYVFLPAPRDLSVLANLPTSNTWTSPDGKTRTIAGPDASIESMLFASDGLEIPYRLEGSRSPKAPTVGFANSLLTSFEMWDPFIQILRAERPDLRILRWDARGRHALPLSHGPVTLPQLCQDVERLLWALRIDSLDILFGVSMGGALTLNFTLTKPGLVNRFVACDFNVASSAANTQAWKDRTAVAENTTSDGTPGMQKLAKMTVERWFHPHTLEAKRDVTSWMTGMVSRNDVQGFKYGCQALWDYDLKPALRSCSRPGLLVVGEGDGKGALVKAMEGFKGQIGENGVELKIVPQAGHLPMCENPHGFWDAVRDSL